MNKTIKCKTCGAEISPRAKRCPFCGEMTPSEVVGQVVLGCLLAPFILILVVIAIVFFLGLFGGLM